MAAPAPAFTFSVQLAGKEEEGKGTLVLFKDNSWKLPVPDYSAELGHMDTPSERKVWKM